MAWTTPTALNYVTSPFDPNRLHPILRYRRPHTGTDYRAPTGTPVYAVADGRVERSGYDRPRALGGTGAGNHIRLDHGYGVTTRYYHLSKRYVGEGQHVHRGQVIGLAGNTGDSTAAHLHFEVRVWGTPVDPVPYVAARLPTTTVSTGVTIPTAPDLPTIPDAPDPIEEFIMRETFVGVASDGTAYLINLTEGLFERILGETELAALGKRYGSEQVRLDDDGIKALREFAMRVRRTHANANALAIWTRPVTVDGERITVGEAVQRIANRP